MKKGREREREVRATLSGRRRQPKIRRQERGSAFDGYEKDSTAIYTERQNGVRFGQREYSMGIERER